MGFSLKATGPRKERILIFAIIFKIINDKLNI